MMTFVKEILDNPQSNILIHQGVSFQIGDMCMRVSTFPVNFDEAMEACTQDGADLISIVNEDIRDAVIELIEKKRLEYAHFQNMDYFWIAGRVNNQSQWYWTTHFQPFSKFTQWQGASPSKSITRLHRIHH